MFECITFFVQCKKNIYPRLPLSFTMKLENGLRAHLANRCFLNLPKFDQPPLPILVDLAIKNTYMRLATFNKDLHILENKNNLSSLIEVEWCPLWERYSFLGEIYHFKAAIINLISTLYTIKSTRVFLAWVSQCNAKI